MFMSFKKTLSASTILIACALTSSFAATPMAENQVPGYYRIQLGQFEVTALYDGSIELDTQLLKNTNTLDVNALLERMFVNHPKMQTAVNAYLINTGKDLVLIDAGNGESNPSLGSLGSIVKNMKAAGYSPTQVDTVILTHLHSDHIGGLNDTDSKPFFPNATIFASQKDHDFWLSEKTAATFPQAMQVYFKMVRDTAAPYQAKERWKTFSKDHTLLAGIKAVNTYGHTPGHTAYEIESDGQKLFIWGDIVHAHAIQFLHPDVSIEFDSDQEQAITTRHDIMHKMAKSQTLVAGMHLPFPGFGHVRAEGNDAYTWVPLEFTSMPTAK